MTLKSWLRVSHRIITYRGQPMLLLADGYDEVSEREANESLGCYRAILGAEVWTVLLSCRSHYIVYELNLNRITLGSFSQGDQIRFVKAYSDRAWAPGER